MMAAAQKWILLLNHHKFDRVALHALGELSDFDTVLVTNGLAPEQQHALRAADVNLQIVGEDGEVPSP
jgi:DeoR/GlpR family transcriptional regulator of sugar metabolism